MEARMSSFVVCNAFAGPGGLTGEIWLNLDSVTYIKRGSAGQGSEVGFVASSGTSILLSDTPDEIFAKPRFND